MNDKNKSIIDFLRTCKMMGFEVIKSNAEQIAINNKANEMPCVVLNDVGYLTPTSYLWYDIDEEIKRLNAEIEANE